MLYFKSIHGLGIFFRIGGPQSEQVSINSIPEEAIANNYKEVEINNLAKLKFVKVQLGHISADACADFQFCHPRM